MALQAQNVSGAFKKQAPGVSLRAGHWANILVARMTLSAWSDHLEERLSYQELHFKKFLPAYQNQ